MSAIVRVGVVIASLGRPDALATWVRELGRQTQKPQGLVFSVTSDADLPFDGTLPEGVTVVQGPKGLCAQRNRGLERLQQTCDVVAFFDDDYVPSRTAIAGVAALFEAHPEVVGAGGLLLADGINTPGLSEDEALAMIADYDAAHPDAPAADVVAALRPAPFGLYGCNMAFRSAAIGDLRFDEVLPLYGWQEDIDFSMAIARRGRLAYSSAFVGVHRGAKGARMSGFRFGYSQIANNWYLARKGTMNAGFAFRLAVRNFIANHWRTLRPEPWVDRFGRVRGNWRALWDIARRKSDPRNIMKL